MFLQLIHDILFEGKNKGSLEALSFVYAKQRFMAFQTHYLEGLKKQVAPRGKLRVLICVEGSKMQETVTV